MRTNQRLRILLANVCLPSPSTTTTRMLDPCGMQMYKSGAHKYQGFCNKTDIAICYDYNVTLFAMRSGLINKVSNKWHRLAITYIPGTTCEVVVIEREQYFFAFVGWDRPRQHCQISPT